MRKIYTFLFAVLITASLFAQAPQKMSYQAVIRDGDSKLVTTQVGMQISILQGSESGTAVYVETQTPTPNINGLVTIEIGTGTTTDDFSAINWAAGPYFIKTETDPTGGTNYTAIVGTSQLLSVPYALYAKNAADYTETDPRVPTGTQTGEMQYWNGTAWITVTAGSEGQVLTFAGGVPTWVSMAAYQLSSTEVYNPTTGKIWMDRNLGALQVATSSTDAASYGDLYQWGRGPDGHELRTSLTTSTNATTAVPSAGNTWDGLFITEDSTPYDWLTPQDDNLWQGVSGTNNPCPSGYRLPTEAEWEAERTSWSSNNSAGAFASPLKLPVAGYRSGSTGLLGYVGTYGFYWSSTISSIVSFYQIFGSELAGMNSYHRASGYSVRCLKY